MHRKGTTARNQACRRGFLFLFVGVLILSGLGLPITNLPAFRLSSLASPPLTPALAHGESGRPANLSIAESALARPAAVAAGVAPEGSLPSVTATLVLLNNTLVPGNFLAANGVSPHSVAYRSREVRSIHR